MKEIYLERLIELKKHYNRWSDAEKEEIRRITSELGIRHNFKTMCGSCYTDAFYLICHTLNVKSKELTPAESTEESKSEDKAEEYTFTGNVNTIWWSKEYGKVLLNEYTDSAVIEAYIRYNPKQNIYIKN